MILHSETEPGEPIVCTPVELPSEMRVSAAIKAIELNPCNAPPIEMMAVALHGMEPTPYDLALGTSKWWGVAGVDLSVSFMEDTPADLRDKILLFANEWSKHCNARFRWTQSVGDLRISLLAGGYWSYLGTDNRSIATNRNTMNLEGFTMQTRDSEFKRVVEHEFGHALGFLHEHTLPDVIELLDFEKCIAIKMRQTGWTRQQVIQQVFTPPPLGSYRMTAKGDTRSVMCYSFTGAETKSGQPILGGEGIDAIDGEFANLVYPKPIPPVVLPPTIQSFVANPDTLRLGETSLLSWVTSGLGTVTLNGKPTVGTTERTSPNATKDYVLTISGPGGTDTKTVRITVTDTLPPPPPSSKRKVVIEGDFTIAESPVV